MKLGLANTFFSSRCFYHVEANAGEEIANTPAVVFLIFHHEDFLAHVLIPPTPCDCRGSVKLKIDPLPGSDSTQMRPPCISIIFFDIDNPSPVPPFLRVLELSIC